MADYLLPCSCGRKLTVNTGQAGDSVNCQCGARIEVPTARRLVHLEKAAEATEPVWDARSGVIFLGIFMLAAATFAGLTMQLFRQSPPSAATLSPADMFDLWIYQSGGPNRNENVQAIVQNSVQANSRNRSIDNWTWSILILGFVGAMVISIGRILPRRTELK